VRAKTTKAVSPPLTKEDKELFEAKETPGKMKYAPRMKVGEPRLGSSITVETVGLGNLKVITQNGNPNV
tara:strand:- start:499 stop:705 length:207 start_codon:yes stop_codon:yes gene_type:complete